ncbi:hypothetical protein Nepgr_005597 [Nepenthes gracilis]|uniref:Uncharacterized protein n=1 Tax=Nepenthes gracilis TaxID=150966 RepID=A0AAD3S3I5_NEPGR|nr:hypothetical protein Nepgr_005597 [Nepenthes gracilis]
MNNVHFQILSLHLPFHLTLLLFPDPVNFPLSAAAAAAALIPSQEILIPNFLGGQISAVYAVLPDHSKQNSSILSTVLKCRERSVSDADTVREDCHLSRVVVKNEFSVWVSRGDGEVDGRRELGLGEVEQRDFKGGDEGGRRLGAVADVEDGSED